SQIVPDLLDQGIYVASESSFYRVLKEAGQLHHRGQSRAPQRSKEPTTHTAIGLARSGAGILPICRPGCVDSFITCTCSKTCTAAKSLAMRFTRLNVASMQRTCCSVACCVSSACISRWCCTRTMELQ